MWILLQQKPLRSRQSLITKTEAGCDQHMCPNSIGYAVWKFSMEIFAKFGNQLDKTPEMVQVSQGGAFTNRVYIDNIGVPQQVLNLSFLVVNNQ